jgi:hypothetical protein
MKIKAKVNMKKIILMLLIVSIAHVSKATHLMGGDIKVIQDSNSFYSFNITHYRDVLGINAGPSVVFSIYVWDVPTSTWMPTNFSSLVIMMDSANSGMALPTTAYGIEIYNYKSVSYYLAPNAKYKIMVTECCRNAAILNMSTAVSESFTLEAEFNVDSLSADNSPEFLALPVVVGPINNVWVYNPLPYDADGDSLAWEISTPLSAFNNMNPNLVDSCLGYTLPPADPLNPFTLNPVSGELTWMPNMVGNFVASFKITEYRNGIAIGSVIRDMQYIVIPDSTANPLPKYSQNSSTPFTFNSINKTNEVSYVPGDAFTFKLLVDDANNTDALTANAYSELLQQANTTATFTSTPTGLGKQLLLNFNWQPSSTTKGTKKVVFRTFDGKYYSDFTLMMLQGSRPASLQSSMATIGTLQIIPNPSNTGAITLSINAPSSNNAVVNIIDAQGKIVYSSSTQLNKGNNILMANTALSSGLYMVKVATANGASSTSKLVIQ